MKRHLTKRHLIETTFDRIIKEKIYNFESVPVLSILRPKNTVISKNSLLFESVSDFSKGSPRLRPWHNALFLKYVTNYNGSKHDIKQNMTETRVQFSSVQFICFVLQTKKYNNICHKNFFRKHRKAAKLPYSLLVNCLPLNSGTKKLFFSFFFFFIRKNNSTLTKTQ